MLRSRRLWKPPLLMMRTTVSISFFGKSLVDLFLIVFHGLTVRWWLFPRGGERRINNMVILVRTCSLKRTAGLQGCNLREFCGFTLLSCECDSTLINGVRLVELIEMRLTIHHSHFYSNCHYALTVSQVSYQNYPS